VSVRVKIDISGKGAQVLLAVREAITDKADLNERMATNALRFVREFGAAKSQTEHATADRLGAKPTGHLERAYRGIESEHDSVSAKLLIPRSSRLRAAFGAYTVRPVISQYLTIPVHADAYGRRAGEFTDLIALRVGPKKNLILARKTGSGEIETMYFLTKKVEIRANEKLIPFREIGEEAAEAVQEAIDAAIERRIA